MNELKFMKYIILLLVLVIYYTDSQAQRNTIIRKPIHESNNRHNDRSMRSSKTGNKGTSQNTTSRNPIIRRPANRNRTNDRKQIVDNNKSYIRRKPKQNKRKKALSQEHFPIDAPVETICTTSPSFIDELEITPAVHQFEIGKVDPWFPVWFIGIETEFLFLRKIIPAYSSRVSGLYYSPETTTYKRVYKISCYVKVRRERYSDRFGVLLTYENNETEVIIFNSEEEMMVPGRLYYFCIYTELIQNGFASARLGYFDEFYNSFHPAQYFPVETERNVYFE